MPAQGRASQCFASASRRIPALVSVLLSVLVSVLAEAIAALAEALLS